ncbi:hypothetical protein BH24CHL7_BH24CHL7_04810 [soil metagenome]
MTRSDEGSDQKNTPAPEPATTEAEEASSGPLSRLQDVASSLADTAGPIITAVRRPVDQLTGGARRRLDERSGARVRRVRQMGRRPLANLWELHPDARRASIRELGLLTVPVEEIAGSAVEGAAQRGGDFLPLRDRRSADWRSRWQRILNAVEGLANLPPVDLLKFGDRYWVVDGHNRVAAALYTGQQAVDAAVEELRMPGTARERTPTAIASVLEGSSDVRQAGAGRLTRVSVRPTKAPLNRDHGHGHQHGATEPVPPRSQPDVEAVELEAELGDTDDSGSTEPDRAG